LISLARKTFEQPARLATSDLDPIREIAGEDALDYTLVIGGFHFVNRIADLLDVPQEILPKPLRRFEFLRRLTVQLGSIVMARMDLKNRVYTGSYEDVTNSLTPYFGSEIAKDLKNRLQPLESRPKLIETLHLALEERDRRSSLDRPIVESIQHIVEESLPASNQEAVGFHPIPKDPIEAFAFVGTRYAHHTTKDMVDAVRQVGYGDLEILDLAIAVADANMWARVYRLVGLEPDLYYFNAGSNLSTIAND
jgi:alkylhydroperoxidase family enzyme